MDFSEKLRSLRNRLGLDQKEFAAMLGVHPSTYNRYERGVRTPSSRFITRIAERDVLSRDELIELIQVREAEEPYQDDEAALRQKVIDSLPLVDKGTVQLLLEIIERTRVSKIDR